MHDWKSEIQKGAGYNSDQFFKTSFALFFLNWSKLYPERPFELEPGRNLMGGNSVGPTNLAGGMWRVKKKLLQWAQNISLYDKNWTVVRSFKSKFLAGSLLDLVKNDKKAVDSTHNITSDLTSLVFRPKAKNIFGLAVKKSFFFLLGNFETGQYVTFQKHRERGHITLIAVIIFSFL